MQYLLTQEEYDKLKNNGGITKERIMAAQAEFVKTLVRNHQMLPGGMIGIFPNALEEASQSFEGVLNAP